MPLGVDGAWSDRENVPVPSDDEFSKQYASSLQAMILRASSSTIEDAEAPPPLCQACVQNNEISASTHTTSFGL